MAIRNCAWISEDSESKFVHNIIVVEESDYLSLQNIWSMFYPNDYILWQDELVTSPEQIPPVGEGWRENFSGVWYDPTFIPPPVNGVEDQNL